MESTTIDSLPHTGGREYLLSRLWQKLDEDIRAYPKAQGRDHLRLDEMFELSRPNHFHLTPKNRKMLNRYLDSSSKQYRQSRKLRVPAGRPGFPPTNDGPLPIPSSPGLPAILPNQFEDLPI